MGNHFRTGPLYNSWDSKLYKITTCASVKLFEALSVWYFDIYSTCSGIDGGTGSNIIFFRIDIVSSNRVMSENYNTIWRKVCAENIHQKKLNFIFFIGGDANH